MTASVDEEVVAGPYRRWSPGWLRERLAASDPAFSRVRLASRAMLSLFLTGAILGLIFLVQPLPIAAFGLAVVISFVGSMAVRDTGGRAQIETRLYGLAAAVVAVFISSLVAAVPIAADLVFLVVIFGAVYVRKFGPRWFAVGMIAFMGYFMGDYLRPQPGDVGWLLLAAAIAFAVTHVVTNFILADDPEKDFRRALMTIDRRIELILSRLLQEGETVRDRAPLQELLNGLREIIMMAEGFIPQGEAGSLAARGAASDLAVALFDVQLIAERLVRASYLQPPPAELLRRAQAGLRIDESADGETAGRLLARLQWARGRLDAALGPSPSPAFVPPEEKAAAAPAAAAAAEGPKPLIPVAWQAPIQVTLACAIAMGVGYFISPTRWYWAVITAFIVFNNAKSRADTAVRALQRSSGTFAGLIGGTILATLLHGQIAVSAVGILVLFFLAFYFVQASYSFMIFLITLALALLYGLMGSFTPDLLVTRLIETVVGGLAGTLVAFVVFPTRAGTSAGATLDKYLSALAEVLEAAKGRVSGAPEPLHLLARSRLLDKSYTELAAAVKPLGTAWSVVTRFGEVRERLLLLTGIAHWARVLARSLPQEVTLAPETVARIGVLSAEIAAQIGAAKATRDAFFERPEKIAEEADAGVRPPLPISEEADPAVAMEVIAALLKRATPVR